MAYPNLVGGRRRGGGWVLQLGVACALAAPALALDPSLALTQLVRRTWNDELPQNTVRAILQTRDGYLWLGTYEGLARFDGVAFTVFDRSQTRDLPGTSVVHLLEDSEGGLWISTNGGLALYRNGVFRSWTTAEGLPSSVVNATELSADGTLWVATASGLARREGERFAVVTGQGPAPVEARALQADRQGALWIASSSGLYRYSSGRFERFTTANGLPDLQCWALHLGRDGTLWVGTEEGLARVRDGVITPFTVGDGLPDPFVRAISEDSDGSLWVGTEDSGLSRIAGGKVSTLGEKDGLTHNHVRSIYEDREGSLWVGTNGGLNQLREGKVTPYTTQEGLSHDFARTVLEGRDGSIWIGTDGGGLSRLENGRFTTTTVADGLSSNSVRSLLEARDGSLWVGTRNGLDHLEGRKVTRYSTRDGLASDLIRAILEDRQGTLWIAPESGGLNRLRDGKITLLTTADGLVGDRPRALYEDRQGALWIGTYDGVSCLRDGKFRNYTVADGLSDNIAFAFLQDSRGGFWVGTDGGLNLLREGRFVSFTRQTGLADDIVFQLLEDDQGWLWMSSNKGISRVALDELYAHAEGRLGRVRAVAYNRSDGMRANQCNGVSQPAGCKTRSGELWFPTVKGVVRIDPRRVREDQPAPPVLIEQVLADGVPLDLGSQREVRNGKTRLELRYTALAFVAPERVRFRYRLDPFESDWVEAGTRRVAFYTAIPPGSYRFQVTACSSDGVWNPTGATWAFLVPTPFYRTWWAIGLAVLAVAAAVGGTVRLRIDALKRQHRVLEDRVAERTAEVAHRTEELEASNRELADTVRQLRESERRAHESERRALASSQAKTVFLSNMSHELRTPLNSIIGFASILSDKLAGVVEPRQEKFLRNILASGHHLLGLINDLLDLAKIEAGRMDLVIEIFDLRDAVEGVCSVIRGVAGDRGITVDVDIADDVPLLTGDPAKVKQILLNLVSNAVKFSHPDSKVAIRASNLAPPESPLGVDTIRVDVVDHGIGIRAEDLEVIFEEFRQAESGANRRYEGSGLGLPLVRKLLQLHGGRVSVASEPGRGSTFSAFLPVVAAPVQPGPALKPSTADAGSGANVVWRERKSRSVLVVEDDPIAYHSLASALEAEGYTVVGARTGEQALQLVANAHPDLVSLDIVLPGMSGWDVLSELRTNAETREVPIVIVTALDSRALGAALGANDFFTKPVEPAEFLRRVRQILAAGADHRRTILVVDDEPDIHEMLHESLSDGGYRLLRAANGPEGLSLARGERPDLVILDLLMPGMSGFEVAYRLRADSATANVPIIVLTAKELTSSDRLVLSKRVATLIPKGENAVAQLTSAIRDLLEAP